VDPGGEVSAIISKMGSSAGASSSGRRPAALSWKLSAEHLGKRPPKVLTEPRTWLTSWVLQRIEASRERTRARCAWDASPRCFGGESSLGSRASQAERGSARPADPSSSPRRKWAEAYGR
jgi:hypothetical protein